MPHRVRPSPFAEALVRPVSSGRDHAYHTDAGNCQRHWLVRRLAVLNQHSSDAHKRPGRCHRESSDEYSCVTSGFLRLVLHHGRKRLGVESLIAGRFASFCASAERVDQFIQGDFQTGDDHAQARRQRAGDALDPHLRNRLVLLLADVSRRVRRGTCRRVSAAAVPACCSFCARLIS